MLQKTIKYTDYNGQEREEKFFFNLSKAELIEMELGTSTSLAKRIDEIVKTNDNAAMLSLFKTMILDSYGKVSEDGRQFLKTPEAREKFSQSEAYSTLFMELLTDEKKATAFISGIIPSNIN